MAFGMVLGHCQKDSVQKFACAQTVESILNFVMDAAKREIYYRRCVASL